jgi:peptidoglycan/xylan/chitin deacetylase (PgdA/CDA1 family)
MTMANNIFKNLILQGAEYSGLLNVLQNIGTNSRQSVYVLAYHRVAELHQTPWLSPELISATPRQFDEQMKFIAERYNPVSIHDLLQSMHGEGHLPKNAVLVTVDDGYRDFKEEILPVCTCHGIQPLLFLPTAFVGKGNFWWDKVYQIIHLSGQASIDTPFGVFPISTEDEKRMAVKQITRLLKTIPFKQTMQWVDATHAALVSLTEEQWHNTLTWDDLRQLINDGVSVACHTHTHPIMTQISQEQAQNEVLVAQALIQRELGMALPVFAFPDGKPHSFSKTLFDMLYLKGFELQFVLVGGRAIIQARGEKTISPRLSVWQRQTLPQFHMRLTPIWAFYETIKLRLSHGWSMNPLYAGDS